MSFIDTALFAFMCIVLPSRLFRLQAGSPLVPTGTVGGGNTDLSSEARLRRRRRILSKSEPAASLPRRRLSEAREFYCGLPSPAIQNYNGRMTAGQAAQEWQRGAERALKAAQDLQTTENYELVLFTCHLAVEKQIKALYIQKHQTDPPTKNNLEDTL